MASATRSHRAATSTGRPPSRASSARRMSPVCWNERQATPPRLLARVKQDDDVGEGRDRRARRVGERDDRRRAAVAIDGRDRLLRLAARRDRDDEQVGGRPASRSSPTRTRRPRRCRRPGGEAPRHRPRSASCPSRRAARAAATTARPPADRPRGTRRRGEPATPASPRGRRGTAPDSTFRPQSKGAIHQPNLARSVAIGA